MTMVGIGVVCRRCGDQNDFIVLTRSFKTMHEASLSPLRTFAHQLNTIDMGLSVL